MRLSIALAVACALISTLSAADSVHATVRKATHIPAQSLGSALQMLAKERGFQVVYLSDAVDALKTQGAVGELTSDEVLQRLLSGTGLTYRYLDERTVTVFPVGGTSSAAPAASVISAGAALRVAQSGVSSSQGGEGARQGEEGGQEEDEGDQGIAADQAAGNEQQASEKEFVEEVVVTGTHIRGIAPDSSPLKVYERQHIEATGAATVEQFLRMLPENFNSIDSSTLGRTNGGETQGTVNAVVGQTGVNLRGLGARSTLTLLNGRRMVPAGTNGDFFDVSMIPLSAVERIEVLTDGASALYGADAVAGVVNFVLRKGFDGMETAVRHAVATQGGARQITISQMLGGAWEEGSGLLVYEFDDQDGLFSNQRDFIPSTAAPINILPVMKRHNAFVNARQEVLEGTTLSVDGFYSEMDSISDDAGGVGFIDLSRAIGKVKQYGGTLGVERELAGDWHVDSAASYMSLKQTSVAYRGAPAGVLVPGIVSLTDANVMQFDLRVGGSTRNLFGIRPRVAIGSSMRKEKNMRSTRPTTKELNRQVSSVYSEVFIPFVDQLNPSMQFLRRLELSAALRYDHYDDIPSSVNPKIGLLWSPLPGLSLRGTYATSYRAPLLDDLLPLRNYTIFSFIDPMAADNRTITLVNVSRDGSLDPERAKSLTLGIDYKPPNISGLSLAATYFESRFRDRIGRVPVVGGLSNIYFRPEVSHFINRAPHLADVEAILASGPVAGLQNAPEGAASIEALFDFRLLNIASSKQSGADLSASYSFNTSRGKVGVNLSAQHLFELDYQAVASVPPTAFLNTTGQPMDFRLLSGIQWSHRGFTASLNIHYRDDYQNNLFTPARRMESWTTADLQGVCEFGKQPDLPLLQNVKIALTVQNITDKDPPFLENGITNVNFLVGYDPPNASALGRLVALRIAKHWGQ